MLNLTNLNELEHRKESIWKTQMIGISAIQIAFYSGVLGFSYVTEIPGQEIFNKKVLFYCSFGLSILSFLFSYSIYNRLSSLPRIPDRSEEVQVEKDNLRAE